MSGGRRDLFRELRAALSRLEAVSSMPWSESKETLLDEVNDEIDEIREALRECPTG